jgi:putative MATE family efflux protein
MNNNQLSEQILTQSLWRIMLRLALPGILGMLVISLNTFVDAIFVGQLIGENAVGGIALALPLTLVVGGLSSLVGVGSASVLSRAIGAKDTQTQAIVFGNLLVLCGLISLPLTILGYWLAEDLIAFMGGKGQILAAGTAYLKIFMLGSFFRVFGVAANMLIRAEGKVQTAMIFAASSMILNMMLNPFFISSLQMGIEGSAWASVTAMIVYSVLNILYFFSGKSSYAVKLYHWRVDAYLLKQILPVGISAMLMQVLFFLQQTIVYKTVAYYGTDNDLNFMGAFYRVIMLAVVPVFGFVQSLQPVVGISYGAKNYERVIEAVKVFSWGGTFLLTFIWLPIQIFPEVVLHWMLPHRQFSARDLFNFRMAILMLPTLPFMFIGITLFQSIGNGRIAGALLMFRQVILYVPIVLISPLIFGLDGVYYASPIVDSMVLVATTWLVWREFARLSPLDLKNEEVKV